MMMRMMGGFVFQFGGLETFQIVVTINGFKIMCF